MQSVDPVHVTCQMLPNWLEQEWAAAVLQPLETLLSQLIASLVTWLGHPAPDSLLLAVLLSAASPKVNFCVPRVRVFIDLGTTM